MGMYRDLLISAKHNNSEAVMELPQNYYAWLK